MSPDQRKTIIDNTSKGTITERVAPSTLKEFSVEYFRYLQQLFDHNITLHSEVFQKQTQCCFCHCRRQPIKDVNRQVIAKNAAPERLWANSREPIRQPLLKRLVGNPDLSPQACQAFTDILCHTYFGYYEPWLLPQ